MLLADLSQSHDRAVRRVEWETLNVLSVIWEFGCCLAFITLSLIASRLALHTINAAISQSQQCLR